jgi:hypothetical protein
MAVGNVFRSDLNSIHNIIQNSMIVYPKEIILATLKDFFSEDSYYHFVKDAWGFTQTPDHTDLPLDAGYKIPNTTTLDTSTTRLFIGENYRFDTIFYPAILVKHGGSKYVPVSINRDTGKVQWSERLFIDGYGQEYIVRNPEHFVFSGAWEGSIQIDIKSRSLRARDDLVELVGIYFTQIGYELLRRSGVIVKPIAVGAPNETEDRNDKLFGQTITLDIRTEWQVNAPILNVLEVINFIMEFGRVGEPSYPTDPNFTINTVDRLVDLIDAIMSGQEFPYFTPLYQPFTSPGPITG